MLGEHLDNESTLCALFPIVNAHVATFNRCLRTSWVSGTSFENSLEGLLISQLSQSLLPNSSYLVVELAGKSVSATSLTVRIEVIVEEEGPGVERERSICGS